MKDLLLGLNIGKNNIHMRKSRKHQLFKKAIAKNKVGLGQGEMIYNLERAWNDLPDDVTFEERILFIELVEKLVKSYRRYRFLHDEEEALSKN